MFDLISQILALMCAVKNEICNVGGPVCHQLLTISHLMLFLCVTHGAGNGCDESLLYKNCLNLEFRDVREGQGGGAALPHLVQQCLKHKSFTFLHWRLLRSSGILSF